MSEWVNISVDESEEPVEVPTEADGTICLASILAQFPNTIGLKYRNPSTSKWRGIRIQDNQLYPPSDEGWEHHTYICVRNKAESPKRDESGLKRKTDSEGEMYSKNIRYDESDDDEPSDLIILGLPYKTTEEGVKEWFTQFGELDLCSLKCKPSGESRGFAFIRFTDKAVEKKVCMQKHFIDGRWCDVRIPESKDGTKSSDQERAASKIFVGKITEDITSQDLREHFETFGPVRDVYIPTPFRHFAFVQFTDSNTAKSLRGKEHKIKNTTVRIGQAVPKAQGNQVAGGGNDGYGAGYHANSAWGGGFGGAGPMGPQTGFSGAGGAAPPNIDFGDIARWAIEMQYSRGGPAPIAAHGNMGGAGRGGGRWGGQQSGGQHTRMMDMGGAEGYGRYNQHFSGRSSKERRY